MTSPHPKLGGLPGVARATHVAEQHCQNNIGFPNSSQRERDSQSHHDLHSDFAGNRAASLRQESISLEGGLADR